MEWYKITDRSGYVLDQNCLMVTYKLNDRELVMIDTGMTKDKQEITELFDRQGYRVKAVLCTHLHMDHIGSNHLLYEHYGCPIYTTDPEVQSVSDLKIAQKELGIKANQDNEYIFKGFDYPVTTIPMAKGKITIGDADFEILPTPGHTIGHIAIVTPDKVCCLGDALLSPAMVKISKLPYMGEIAPYLASMESLLDTHYDYYAFAHQEVVDHDTLIRTVHDNIAMENQMHDMMLRLLTKPYQLDAYISLVLYELNIRRFDPESVPYKILAYTSKARAVYLNQCGRLKIDWEKKLIFPVKG